MAGGRVMSDSNPVRPQPSRRLPGGLDIVALLAVIAACLVTVMNWRRNRGETVISNETEGLMYVGQRYGPATMVAFAPDGRLFACGTGQGKVELWDLKNARHQAVLE